ncbi:hypothetical protein QQS21_004921 [Conoideocrella luteorostrata]|uniref:Uncharacterized protein n=1 Tax=Conoideocrella luteorostrata TaxID=1105319 RepID=A0AAJ0CT73_9HYPO|nr:hypothetical protein QQS21_004921 [Conoideocrella luteorostrata]
MDDVLRLPYCTDLEPECAAICREIFLSYRLLFGQKSSRTLLEEELTKLSSSVRNTQSAQWNQSLPTSKVQPSALEDVETVDAFLLDQATSNQWYISRLFRRGKYRNRPTITPSQVLPSTFVDSCGKVGQYDTYSTILDFPVFGQRLVDLQLYSTRTQPSRVRDLWRDRRNPLQWYTFWAVIWFGSAGILLGALQLAASIAQVAAAFKPGA